jgi:hypothetical protein
MLMRESFSKRIVQGGNSNFCFTAECKHSAFYFQEEARGTMVKIIRAFIGIGCLALFVINPAASQRRGGQVTVLRSDERSFVFEYRANFFPERTLHEGNAEMKMYDFAGSIPTLTREAVGAPDLRYEAIPLGFPAENGNAVQVIASDYQDISGVTLAPIPTMRLHDEMVEIAGYRIDADKYSASSFIPVQVVELPAPNHAQTMLVGSVKLFPIQFNPASRTVRKYTRLVVEVVFGASTRPRTRNNDDIMFDGVLLNYSVARNWKFAEQRSMAKTTIGPSVLATGDWYRLTVVDEGVYILNAAYLRAAGINTAPPFDPRTIRVFGNGGTEVPENVLAPRPTDLVENAIYVEGESDGRFDEGDYVLFFAKSVRGWRYNTSSHLLDHYIHHYTEQNYYWLTFGGGTGRRMPVQQSLSDNPAVVPTKFLDMVLIEEETSNLLSSGKDWFGRSYTSGSAFTYVNLLPGLAQNDIITYRFRLIARSNVPPAFTVTENGTLLGTYGLSAVFYESPNTYASEGTFTATGTSNLSSNTSRLSFAFSSGSVSGTGWNDWIEIQYPRRFEAVSNSFLRFRSPDNASGVTQYTLEQFSSLPVILNVTRPDSVSRITGAVGTYTFRVQETPGEVSEYCAANAGGFKQPAAVARINNQNLQGDLTGADFIILTSPEYRTAANRLKDYREQPAHGGLRDTVIDVNQIYNEFGCGLPDVSAIRDYLKYAYDNWTRRPRFVLFLGQGSYDYKGLPRTSFVPTWQSDQSLDGVESYCTDDFFVKFGTGSTPFLTTGRVNARTPAEADAFVTKLMQYEDRSARDPWKMRMLFVGDDGWTSECGDCEGTIHSDQVERLATEYTPNEFEKRKIYIAEYPTVQSAQGRRKPGAYQAIIDQINEGVLVSNYTGHGNPLVWAHENVFNVQTSIPALVNASKLSVFFLATCNFSQFDDLRRYTGSELLINKPDGGAIGVVSASRKVYADQNAYLHQQIFAKMFTPRDPFGRLVVKRPAEAIYLFKSTGSNVTNDQKYFFMGDPTMRLQYPQGYARIDTINHEPVDTVNGLPRQTPIQLKALSKVSIKGTIRDLANQPDTTFDGRLLLSVNDASRTIAIPGFGNPPFHYLASGGTVYRGQNSVTKGMFSATFVVPKDILYADSTSRGRLVAYFIDSVRAYEGAGYTENMRIGGTEIAAVDTAGPGMSLYLDSRSFRTGDPVREEPTLFVDLVDSNGINTSVSGIGHRIEAWVNGSSQSKDITDYYTSQLDEYQRGTVQYTLKGLPQGRNSVRVRAWDTHNNASLKETSFEVTTTDQLRISDVFNYPNPFPNGTTFTFRQNLMTALNVTVKIYTLAGRLIQSLDAISPGEPFVKIPWDGRDRDGDILANGVYLYKVIVRTTDGQFGSEVLGKLSVLK